MFSQVLQEFRVDLVWTTRFVGVQLLDSGLQLFQGKISGHLIFSRWRSEDPIDGFLGPAVFFFNSDVARPLIFTLKSGGLLYVSDAGDVVKHEDLGFVFFLAAAPKFLHDAPHLFRALRLKNLLLPDRLLLFLDEDFDFLICSNSSGWA